jgi:hypothetical protein
MEDGKMKLSIMERLISMGLLPSEADYATLKIVRDAKGILGITSEESVDFKVVSDPEKGTIVWDVVAEMESGEKDILLSPAAIGLIASALAKLEKDKKLTEQHFTLYEKFYTAPEKQE